MPTPTFNPAAADFIKAVQAGAYDRAAATLPTLTGSYSEALHCAVADLQSHRRLWDEAAAALETVNTPDAQLKRNLFRNIAALKSHRPAVYRAVLAELERPSRSHCPHALPDGRRTVARVDNGRAIPLSTDPTELVASAAKQLNPLTEQGKPLAFLSVHDGNVLLDVAKRPPTLFLGRQQPLYVIEPDVGLLTAALLAHDFTGPLGPLEQPRVAWHVGENWFDSLRVDVLTDRYLIFPQTNVKQNASGKAIEAKMTSLLAEIGGIDAVAAADVNTHYGPLTPDDYARALRGEAGRPARVLLLTTRFSTVLQYSTRDAEDALRRLGCETHLLIEPTPYGGMSRVTLRRALADFKPDLVFQIDHHRFEHGDLFPAGLPFVNWVQDLLPHLMTQETGRKLGKADFALVPSLQRWVDDFAYPRQQCVEFRKLTRVPWRPLVRDTDEKAVVYVSNWGQNAADRVDELLTGQEGNGRRVMGEACERMRAVYARGESLSSPGDVRRLLEATLADCGLTADEATVRQTSSTLFDRLNNLLYRQQGLAWAAEACAGLGLRLDVYGTGWDRNPQFAAHARGHVDYGAALETLTRRAAVNLILEPFMSVSHQRLLDALVAGGFCLVRNHPTNETSAEWIDLLARADATAVNGPSLRAALRDDDVARFDANFAACDGLDVSPKRVDHVATVVRLRDGGFFPRTGQTLPLLDRVVFESADTLRRQLVRSQDAEFRTGVAAAQRKHVESYFSYASGMRRVLAFVAGGMGGTQNASNKVAA